MDKLIIRGRARLKGEVDISGSKNAVLPIMAAALLSEEESVIENVPNLWDVQTMVKLLRSLGAKAILESGVLKIKPGNHLKPFAPYKLVKTMRASVCVLGPLLARLGEAEVSLPGGCAIGPRPIDLHLKGLEALRRNPDDRYTQRSEAVGTNICAWGGYGCRCSPRKYDDGGRSRSGQDGDRKNTAYRAEVVDLPILKRWAPRFRRDRR